MGQGQNLRTLNPTPARLKGARSRLVSLSMKTRYLFLTVFLLSCNPEKHDIDKGIEEMAEYREETPVEDTVAVDCLHDTSYYKLTMAAIRGVPDANDVQWLESEHAAVINWRGDEVRRSRGGCMRFAEIHRCRMDSQSISSSILICPAMS